MTRRGLVIVALSAAALAATGLACMSLAVAVPASVTDMRRPRPDPVPFRDHWEDPAPMTNEPRRERLDALLTAAARAYASEDAEVVDLVEYAKRRRDYRARRGGRVCSRCGQAKALASFVRDSRARDGRASICRSCKSEENAARRRDE